MQFLAIEASSGEVSELELQMQANTLYTYFDSILIDELMPLNGHVVYSDANALSEKKKAYFMSISQVAFIMVVQKQRFI